MTDPMKITARQQLREVSHDLATLRAAAAALRQLYATDDADLVAACQMIRRKQLDCEEHLDHLMPEEDGP